MQKNIAIVLTVLVVLILAVGGYFLYTYRAEVTRNEQQQEQEEVIVESKKVTDTTKPIDATVTYPYIAGANDFNKKVEEIYKERLGAFKKAALDNDVALKEIDPQGYAQMDRSYVFAFDYEQGVVNDTMASFVFKIYEDTGGAHGNGYFMGFTYNLKDKKEMTLAEVYQGQSDYLKKISDYTLAELTKQITERVGNADGSWVKDGVAPKEENFSAFLVKEKEIVFYFAPYQVAAYAVGDFQVIMPR